jgi:hypothetical protein
MAVAAGRSTRTFSERPPNSEIADAWISAQETNEHESWAIQCLIDMSYRDPQSCWEIVQLIHSRTTTDEVRGTLAAGPLEDLLVHHPEQFFPHVKELAGRDARFKDLLAGVWLDGNDSPIWREFYELAGAEPPFPPGWFKHEF